MDLMLDPGHGGTDSGAVGLTGLKEKDIALEFALLMRPALRSLGWEVSMTRSDDRYIDLSTRAAMANGLGVAGFVSIHCNSYSDPRAHGFEVWTSPGTTDADLLATAIYEHVRERFPGRRLRRDLADGDDDKEAGFAVLRLTWMPAVLVELGFLSNLMEGQDLSSPLWQWQMASALTAAIDEWMRRDS